MATRTNSESVELLATIHLKLGRRAHAGQKSARMGVTEADLQRILEAETCLFVSTFRLILTGHEFARGVSTGRKGRRRAEPGEDGGSLPFLVNRASTHIRLPNDDSTLKQETHHCTRWSEAEGGKLPSLHARSVAAALSTIAEALQKRLHVCRESAVAESIARRGETRARAANAKCSNGSRRLVAAATEPPPVARLSLQSIERAHESEMIESLVAVESPSPRRTQLS